MDKNEQLAKIEELKAAMKRRDFELAVSLADQLDFRKIKDNNFLSLIADAYELTHNYENAKRILLMAYENTNAGRHLAYRLCLVSVKTKDFEEAEEFYEDFVEMAPRDTSRYILKYKMAKAQNVPVEELIPILEEYTNLDMDEKWAYELAKLYKEAGENDKCVDICNEIGLWFAEGKYVSKAKELSNIVKGLASEELQEQLDNELDEIEENYEIKPEEIKEQEQEDSFEDIFGGIIEKDVDKSGMVEIIKNEATGEQAEIEDKNDSAVNKEETIIEEELPQEISNEDIADNNNEDISDNSIEEKTNNEESEIETENAEKTVDENTVDEKKSGEEKSDEENLNKEDSDEEDLDKENSDEEDLWEDEPISDVKGVQDILKQLQERGILTADTVKQAVSIIEQSEEKPQPQISAFDVWEADNVEQPKEEADNVEQPKEEADTTSLQSQKEAESLENITEEQTKNGNTVELDLAQIAEADEILYRPTERIPETDDLMKAIAENKASMEAEETLAPSMQKAVEPVETKMEDVPVFDLGEGMNVSEDEVPDKETSDSKLMEDSEKNDDAENSIEPQDVDIDNDSPIEINNVAEQINNVAEQINSVAEQINSVAKQINHVAEPVQNIEPHINGNSTDKITMLPEEKNVDAEVEQEIQKEVKTKTAVKEELPLPEQTEKVFDSNDVEVYVTDEEMSVFKNYLNVEGLENAIKEVIYDLIANYNPDGKSTSGNVIISGENQTGKTTLAIELIKLVNKKRGRRDRKLAKIKASALNRRGFRNSLNKLLGCDLIIEDAHELGVMTLSEIIDVAGSFTDGMIIILEGKIDEMQTIVENSARITEVFNHTITIREYDIKEWVAYGIQYANEKGYSLDELAKLAFYKAIDDYFGLNKGIGQADVEGIVDNAIDKSKRLGKKISGIFGNKKGEDGLAILKEADFNI